MTSIFKLSAFIAALGIPTLGVVPAAHAASPDEKATVVLVHGAFADGSSWDEVIPALHQQGLKVVSVQNPLRSLADDVAVTRRALDAQTGPVVLFRRFARILRDMA